MGGAYLLHFRLLGPAIITIGALGRHLMPPGEYVYVGSARGRVDARVARHERLVRAKSGNIHWHIDFMLVHPLCELSRTEILRGGEECRISRSIAQRMGVEVPVPGFGSSDCRSGCPAHLYRLSTSPA